MRGQLAVRHEYALGDLQLDARGRHAALLQGLLGVAQVVGERSGGRCEANTPACTGTGQHFHHVLRRSQGGKHSPANLLHLCVGCHGWVHDNPAESYERGWLKRGVS
jgi:5-methylcytosine-specific restriction endonuclease McrA